MAFRSNGQLDPGRPVHIACVGKKGTGKSELAGVTFDSYPHDRMVIDVTGDVGPIPVGDPDRETYHEWHGADVPARWRRDLQGRRQTVRYVPDPASPSYRADLDRAMGLAYQHGKCMVWVDEGGEVAPVAQVGPHARQGLHQGRHQELSQLWCMPRPKGVDVLVLAQADLVYVFWVPNPDDRKRIADTIGWPPDEFDAAVLGLAEHEYLRFDALAPAPGPGQADMRLVHFPALPAEVIERRRARAARAETVGA